MTPAPPPPEAQLQFLAKLQRLFAEGDFTATYKCALLMALADEAVENGADNGSDHRTTVRALALRFVGLYWRHALPYGLGRPGSTAGVLLQNAGSQAAVVRAIQQFRSACPAASLNEAQAHPQFSKMLDVVAATVSAQPLRYLQNLGGEADEFLYQRTERRGVHLKPGVMYCLRRFYPLVQQLARSHWIDLVKRNRANTAILGEADDLGEFMFGTPRQSLKALGAALVELEGATCFYCRCALTSFDVDHVVPFSLYPRDVAQNMVLSCERCNRSKSDALVARFHLARWCERLVVKHTELTEIGRSVGLAGTGDALLGVARWAYSSAKLSGGRAWSAPRAYELIDDTYDACFGS